MPAHLRRRRPSAAEAGLRAAIGDTLAMPDLSAFGLRLAALHRAVMEGRPAVLLRYAAADGSAPVSCYYASVAAWGETAFASSEIAGVGAVYRIDDGIGYAVVGRRPPAELRRIAAAGFRYLHEAGGAEPARG